MDYRAELARRGIPDPEAWGFVGWALTAMVVIAAAMITYPPRPTRCFESIEAFQQEHPNATQWFQTSTGCPDGEVSITFRRWGF
jgi:hypothetical protein